MVTFGKADFNPRHIYECWPEYSKLFQQRQRVVILCSKDIQSSGVAFLRLDLTLRASASTLQELLS